MPNVEILKRKIQCLEDLSLDDLNDIHEYIIENGSPLFIEMLINSNNEKYIDFIKYLIRETDPSISEELTNICRRALDDPCGRFARSALIALVEYDFFEPECAFLTFRVVLDSSQDVKKLAINYLIRYALRKPMELNELFFNAYGLRFL